MNIFVLDLNPVTAAQLQCDKHVVKMIVESAQMLSTAHRMLDGTLSKLPSKSGKRLVNHYLLDNSILYNAVHQYHPCTVWTMQSSENYKWHWNHFVALCNEYTYRYNKKHATELKLKEALKVLPKNIPIGDITQFSLAMGSNPECMFPNDPVKSYRLFYKTKKDRFKMVWTNRNTPEWFL